MAPVSQQWICDSPNSPTVHCGPFLDIVSDFQTLPFSFSNVIHIKFKIGGQLPIGGKSPSDLIIT